MLIKNSIAIYNERRPHFFCFYKTTKKMLMQSEIKIKTFKNKYPRDHSDYEDIIS